MHYRGPKRTAKAQISDGSVRRYRNKRRWSCKMDHWRTAGCGGLLVVLIISLLRAYDIQRTGRQLKHKLIYDKIRQLSPNVTGIRRSNSRDQPPDSPMLDYQHLISETYGPNILECPITSLFLDPRSFPPGHPAWFALESLSYALPEACVLLLGNTTAPVYALPLFQAMIERGQVRRAQLHVQKYNMKLPFTNPSKLLLNASFWRDEFGPMDSNHILFLQDDSVFCQPSILHVLKERYFGYAFVGAVWPATANPMLPFPPEGMCIGAPIRWRSWLLPQRQWKRGKRAKPNAVYNESMVFCGDKNGIAPVGNGGFSLRQASWLVRALEVCHGNDNNTPCRVLEDLNEDFYFATVLRGMGAPLPSALAAARFSVESIWPEEAAVMYGVSSKEEEPNYDKHRQFRYKGKYHTVPIGVHKPYWYNPNEVLEALQPECPFLEYIYDESMNRWDEFEPSKTQAWIGIGK